MLSQKLQVKTPYEAVYTVRTAQKATEIGVLSVLGFMVSFGIISQFLESQYGVSVFQMVAPGGRYYLVIVYILFLFFAYCLAYTIGTRLYIRKLVKKFASNPSCYSCDYPLSGLVLDRGGAQAFESVIICPECGAACPVVCLKDGKLVPVGALRAGA